MEHLHLFQWEDELLNMDVLINSMQLFLIFTFKKKIVK